MQAEHRHGIGKEHPNAHTIMLSCGVLFVTIWILDSIFFHFGIEITSNIHIIFRIILFLIALILSFKLGMSSHNKIFDYPDASSPLVNESVFAYVRHPMYLSILLLKLGFLLLTMSLISIITLIISLYFYNIIAEYEEIELEKILGEEYINYKKRVGRWVPRLSAFLVKK